MSELTNRNFVTNILNPTLAFKINPELGSGIVAPKKEIHPLLILRGFCILHLL